MVVWHGWKQIPWWMACHLLSLFSSGRSSFDHLGGVLSWQTVQTSLHFTCEKFRENVCVFENVILFQNEEAYISRKIEEENIGKRNSRKNTPWKAILTSKPVWVAVAALVCHEFPLVIMLQFLPKFFSDVLGLSNTVNGLVSALPMGILFLSKCLSSSLASYLTANGYLSKILNFFTVPLLLFYSIFRENSILQDLQLRRLSGSWDLCGSHSTHGHSSTCCLGNYNSLPCKRICR